MDEGWHSATHPALLPLWASMYSEGLGQVPFFGWQSSSVHYGLQSYLWQPDTGFWCVVSPCLSQQSEECSVPDI